MGVVMGCGGVCMCVGGCGGGRTILSSMSRFCGGKQCKGFGVLQALRVSLDSQYCKSECRLNCSSTSESG